MSPRPVYLHGVAKLSQRVARDPMNASVRAELVRVLTELRAAGLVGKFVGLYQGDRRVAARRVEGKFGMQWLLHADEIRRFGRKWLPSGPSSRIHRELGLREAQETAPADAEIQGGGDTSAYVHVFRTGDMWGLDATEVQRIIV